MIHSQFNRTLFASLLLIVVATVGCSSGGRSIAKVDFCDTSYEPLSLDDKNNFGDKLEVKPGKPFNPPVAHYAYDGAEFFYHDKANDIKFHLVDAKDSTGKFVLGVRCYGGLGTNKNTVISFEIPIVSDFEFNDQNQTQIRTRTLTIDAKNHLNEAFFKKSITNLETEYKPGSPQDTYANFIDSTQELVNLKNKAFKGLKYSLIAHSMDVATNQKSGKVGELEVRTLVHLRQVTAEERQKIDDGLKNPPPPTHK